MPKILHQKLAAGGWAHLSLTEQLANIGSEVGRTERWRTKDEKTFWGAAERALELFDLTLSDPRWRKRLREINRAREVFADALWGGRIYHTSLLDLDKYFLQFALLARR
ncbi:MAG: hypothetical protein COU85_02785 [Candidatus Portnoybacteria bacterium CG10_big_fil_rev_8_21_14_0_10_44_7]|uniref:Uncharacterized protein n=1 Tax=Candidatus Portnoybacteria bacterium CG10_big_fil_rev_8_21_14_0_10_44_7 TaxID=1974816 RepID=A0A2M8KI66_9BACT|nr:MAG: hypothetical protein COU85_02785 [Candidatus Portnoybacteria bacterium CG10_big_fil_rev_8_21_14_0_10_44_7]